MSDLLKRLIKDFENASALSESDIFKQRAMVPTPVPMVNVLLSGDVDGGIQSGVTMIAGPSKHFKTGFALLLAKSYLDFYPDSVLVFFDSEFGSPQSYFETFGIDIKRVAHYPVTEVEELRHQMSVVLDRVTKGDRIFVIVDSIGNLASRKEVQDALEGNDKADMTRAKVLKSLFRVVSAKCVMKDIPMVAINHTYKEQSMFPKDIVSGGTGAYYNSSDIWIVGRQQEKDDKELAGFNYVINVEKSRLVKEKSRIPITVLFKEGIKRYSGFLDLAIEGGYVKKFKSKTMVYQMEADPNQKQYTLDEIENDEDAWNFLFKETDFKAFIRNKYALASGSILGDKNEDGSNSE